MIRFNAKTEEEFQTEILERDQEIALEIVKCICDALDENVDKVIIGVIAEMGAELSAKREGFLEALKANLHKVEEAEDYELCSRTKIWIEKLETE